MRPLEPIRFSRPLREVTLMRAGATPVDWQEQVAAAARSGYERGLIDGEKALSEQLLRQRAELLDLHNGAITALRQAVPAVVRQSEEALITLAFDIACKLVAEAPITKEIVAAVVRDALAEVEGTTEFTVQLHPEDFALLRDHVGLVGAAPGQQMKFTASADIQRGGCLVQTRFGIIDARRETKLARIQESLGLGE